MNIEEILAELVSPSFKGLTDEEFARKVEDEVTEDLSELVAVERFFTKFGKAGRVEVLRFANGLAATVTSKGLWALYESQSRIDEREYLSSWARFIRGSWVRRVPSEAGEYFCRDLDLGRRSVRELRLVEGRLVDVSGGLVPPGKVSNWGAYWWSHATPRLPESY